ncbi:MurR/RpiR family transcriptional regulator [Mesoplasma syrphidae]|uniref:MurR/RpiR family transcriptional regulator n=1 Tax=Mesoplasma syrphidae TaxID=225999 RepID=A0A2K9C878_9MOLU|nr:MurR/RpiR family transcriptional regulator [Mesoplasma syrphidae]AUF83205.1 MurR/RpiR family transcriptional regulator [Mesoplasma syrphidae]
MSKIINRIENIKEEENKIGSLIARSLHNSYLTGKFLSLKEIADACFVSQSTVTVFAKHLGCSGYRELITTLKIESNNLRANLPDKVDDFDLLAEFERSTIKTFKDQILYNEELVKISNIIKKSNNTFVLGAPQLLDETQYFCELLSVKISNIFLLSRRLSTYMFDKVNTISSGDTVVLFVAGNGTKTEVELYDMVTGIEGVKALVFCSESQLWKFEKKANDDTIIINIDSDYFPHQPLFRKLQVNYFLIKLFLLI